MPYCCQCGTEAGARDAFCGRCGARQPGVPIPPEGGRKGKDIFADLGPRNTAALCYVPFAGWIMAIVVLATERFRQDAQLRFHAFQGIYLFVAWLLVDWVIRPMMSFPGGVNITVVPKLLKAAVIFSWVLMLVKTFQGQNYRLPLIGELADRSVAEQR